MNVKTGHHMNQECMEAISGNNSFPTNDIMHDIMHDIDDATRAPTTTTSMTAVTTAV